MKDLKTTLTGLAAGLPIAVDAVLTAYAAGQFTGKTGVQLVVAVAIILLGAFSADSKKIVAE